MRTLRFFCDISACDTVTLDPIQSKHLSKVLRLGPGDEVEIFDGKGLLADARIEQIGRQQVTVRLLNRHCVPKKTTGRIVLAVSMAKGERFDWMIEKCTELGVDHIAAVQYDRTVKMGKESVLNRYQKITLAAAKQCGRLMLPALSGPADLSTTLNHLRRLYPNALWCYGDPNGQPFGAEPIGNMSPDRIVCIGPEGGFSDSECRIFSESAVLPVCINPNVLRIETAAVAFAALLSASTGNMPATSDPHSR